MSLKQIADYYISLGLNVTAIDPEYTRRICLSSDRDLYKEPVRLYDYEKNRYYFDNVDWDSATGVGVYLGYASNCTIALDLDEWRRYPESVGSDHQLDDFLSILGLPKDYEWVTLSGSGKGAHIILRVPAVNMSALGGSIAFKGKDNCHFGKIELRCDGVHLVLPPSRHSTGNRYRFRSVDLPDKEPTIVDPGKIYELLAQYFLPLKESNHMGSRQEPLLSHVMESDECEIYPSDSYNYPTVREIGLLHGSTNSYAYNRLGLLYYLEGLRGIGLSYLRASNTNLSKYNLSIIDSTSISKLKEKNYIVLDTETTGLCQVSCSPRKYERWPRLVQIGWVTLDEHLNVIRKNNIVVKPNGFDIPEESIAIHGITNQYATEYGEHIKYALNELIEECIEAKAIVGHNLEFDLGVIFSELIRLGIPYGMISCKLLYCTMKMASLSNPGAKYPSLNELHQSLFGNDVQDAHDALNDAVAAADCFKKLIARGNIYSGGRPSWLNPFGYIE